MLPTSLSSPMDEGAHALRRIDRVQKPECFE